jgi:elongator complex protein 1
VRIGWRGDAQFFVVSVVEDGGEELGPGKRVVRIYSRAGILQSTAEPVPGV